MKMTLRQRDRLTTAIQAVLGTLIIFLSIKESAKNIGSIFETPQDKRQKTKKKRKTQTNRKKN